MKSASHGPVGLCEALSVEMKGRIFEKLKAIERENGFRMLYAVESGSRAWGFASEDSDYDIRFIYVWPRDEYLSIFDPPNMFDYGVDDEDLDITGWDLRKALPLFRKANGSLMEWLFSPIVYYSEDAAMDEWRSLVPEFFVPRSSAAHYLGLSRKMSGGIEEKESVPAKKYLYALRAVLAAQYICEKREPTPVLFAELRSRLDLPAEIEKEIDSMISEKATGNESDLIPRVRVLDDFLREEQDRLNLELEAIGTDEGDIAVLDRFFRKLVAER